MFDVEVRARDEPPPLTVVDGGRDERAEPDERHRRRADRQAGAGARPRDGRGVGRDDRGADQRRHDRAAGRPREAEGAPGAMHDRAAERLVAARARALVGAGRVAALRADLVLVRQRLLAVLRGADEALPAAAPRTQLPLQACAVRPEQLEDRVDKRHGTSLARGKPSRCVSCSCSSRSRHGAGPPDVRQVRRAGGGRRVDRRSTLRVAPGDVTEPMRLPPDAKPTASDAATTPAVAAYVARWLAIGGRVRRARRACAPTTASSSSRGPRPATAPSMRSRSISARSSRSIASRR